MTDQNSSRQNQILAALPVADYQRLVPHLELITLTKDDIGHELPNTLSYVYFPTTSIMSLIYVMEDGASAETATIGNDGMVGVTVFMGGDAVPCQTVVQTAGFAYRLKKNYLLQEFDRSSAARNVMLRYAFALMTQMSLTAACNRHHSIEQQLCRWLLSNLDRLRSNELTMTHELIANTLGVRREGITEAAGKLRNAGYIRYNRGHITVLDRLSLEKHSCECYSVVKKAMEMEMSPARIAA